MKSFLCVLLTVALCSSLFAGDLPIVSKVELQPLRAQTKRVVDALDYLGVPLAASDKTALSGASNVEDIQKIIDRHCLLGVTVNPEQRVKVAPGPASPIVDENGWKVFLVKIANEAGTTAELKVESPNAAPIYMRSSGSARPQEKIKKEDVAGRWLDLNLFNQQPLTRTLTGLEVEYRVLQLYCGDRTLGSIFSERDKAAARNGGQRQLLTPTASGAPRVINVPSSGRDSQGAFKREAKISFNVGQGTQDLGFRNDADLLFTCNPSTDVKLRVQDEDGKPTMGAFIIRDLRGRVYPSQAKRLAPDFFFHPQVYRQDGEVVKLPPGQYNVEYTRGPEYRVKSEALNVPSGAKSINAAFKLERWTDPAKFGWISGDHHIHAAGCAHYENPTEGVFPEDMWRHILGEDLKVGCSLTWGPCYYYQKQFFTGKVDKLSTDKYVMRYDIEVSGWSSHRSGHLCILRLKDQDYPGAKVQEDWPNLGLSVLKWAKAQGAVTGPAHSGWGLDLPDDKLPNYAIPPYSGIGANEYIMQVTHMTPGPDGKPVPAVDMMSTVDTPYVWELNMWYHTLNAGFRTRASGETDFPCIYGERVGLGRVYAKLDNPKKIDFDKWIDAVAAGRSYVSDGKSHLIDFKVNGLEVGTKNSELKLAEPGTVTATAKVAALLNPSADDPIAFSANPVTGRQIHNRPYAQKPYWDVERARIGDSREVPVELIVNGYPVAKKNIAADGTLREVTFDNVQIDRSSWVAMRILATSHTNPVFVLVGDKPIRASRRSVEWCLQGVDVCWNQKQKFYTKPGELELARQAFDHAREVYRKRLAETEVE